jgi:hypothetical protein
MRCIARLFGPELTCHVNTFNRRHSRPAALRAAVQTRPDMVVTMGVHVSSPTRWSQARLHHGEQPLKGVTRLVNPLPEEPKSADLDQDVTERDYLGRVLHVADRALGRVKRPRRGRPH